MADFYLFGTSQLNQLRSTAKGRSYASAVAAIELPVQRSQCIHWLVIGSPLLTIALYFALYVFTAVPLLESEIRFFGSSSRVLFFSKPSRAVDNAPHIIPQFFTVFFRLGPEVHSLRLARLARLVLGYYLPASVNEREYSKCVLQRMLLSLGWHSYC